MALLGAGAPAWAFRSANYFPLFNNPGATWTYNIANGGGTVTARVLSSTFTVNGVTVRAIERTGAWNLTQYFTNDANGIVLHQETDLQVPTDIGPVDQTVVLSPGLKYATATMELNQTVNSSGTATINFGPPLDVVGPQVLNYTASSTVLSINEPVTVPAGSFGESVKVFTSLRIYGTLFAGTPQATPFDATTTQTIWSVRDLGTVKEIDDGDAASAAELVSSSVPALTPSTGTLNFGRHPVGAASAPLQVTLSNTGTTPFVTSPFIQVGGDFALGSNDCASVPQGSPCTIGITFSPTAAGTRTGTAQVWIQNDFLYPHQVIDLVGGGAYAARDFGLDGKSDVFWRHTDGTTLVWRMNGTAIANAGAGVGSPATVPAGWTVEGFGDFDGDGKADILWRHTASGTMYVWLMNGTAIASTGSPATVGDASAGWVVVGVGDFDGDGKADVLWQNTLTGNVYAWLMNGTAIANASSLATVTDAGWVVQGVGDFDGDGKADVLWKHDNGVVLVWRMNGASIASAGSPTVVNAAAGWVVRGIGDFDGDGKADVLWTNGISGTVYLWQIGSIGVSAQFVPAPVANLGPEWVVQGVGDYDGDGKSDILWRNTASGTVFVWLMNGTAISATGSPATVSDPNWVVQNPK